MSSSSKAANSSTPSSTYKCIGETANWSSLKPSYLFDKPEAFIPDLVSAHMQDASPKLFAMLQKIRECDEEDLRKEGHLFKHMIFSGNPNVAYGAKIIASSLIAAGYAPVFDASHNGSIRHKPEQDMTNSTFTMLLSKPMYGKKMTTYFRKHTLELFNKRPDNIHGDQIRIICLDGGFREGIDLYDIKYVHLLEPTPIKADERQAIGRATRFCGQKGLTFHPQKGWPLHVFKYEVSIPDTMRPHLQDTNTFLELQMKYSDIDLREIVFAADLETIGAEVAVDKMLTKAVHRFKVSGGSGDFDNDNKEAYDGYDANDTLAPAVCGMYGGVDGLYDLRNKKVHPPSRIMKHKNMQSFVTKNFAKFAYPKAKLENGCLYGGGSGLQVPASFTSTQDFIRNFFQPSSAYKGMLLWHSVGTGKTCSGIATASTSFEKDGYTILWVTRHTLKIDVSKNLYGHVICSVPLQERLNQGHRVTKSHVSDNWMKPISYKQFSNMLNKENKIYYEMVEKNGEDDPLHKTLIIIDEAHKLYAPDTPAAEKPNMDVLERMVQNSYEKSGKDSVRLLLMTGTPYTRSAMEMVKLLNLMRYQAQFPYELDDFQKVYLNEDGSFTESGKKRFMDETAGYISYLNRSSDARNFAYPVLHEINAPMSLTQVQNSANKFNRYTRTIKNLKQELKDARKTDKAAIGNCVNNAKDAFDHRKNLAHQSKQDAKITKEQGMKACNEQPKKGQKQCKDDVKAAYETNIDNADKDLKAAKDTFADDKENCNNTAGVRSKQINEQIKRTQDEYDTLRTEKTRLWDAIQTFTNDIKAMKEELEDLLTKKRADLARLRTIDDKEERKRQRQLLSAKYSTLKDLDTELNHLRQAQQKAKLQFQLVNEKIGTRFPEDVSQQSALRKRCKLPNIPNPNAKAKAKFNSASPKPNKKAISSRSSSTPYDGPTAGEFEKVFVQGYNEQGDAGAKRAYRKLTLMYHPDKHLNEQSKYTRIFKVLSNTWQQYKTKHNIVGGDHH